MREVSQSEYDIAKAMLAAYREYCKPYVQKNGWTSIPADAPPMIVDGAAISTDCIDAHSTNVQLYELAHDKPAKFSAYVSDSKPQTVMTWTGEIIGRIVDRTAYHTNNFGGRYRTVWARCDWGGFAYVGREYDSRNLVNFRVVKSK